MELLLCTGFNSNEPSVITTSVVSLTIDNRGRPCLCDYSGGGGGIVILWCPCNDLCTVHGVQHPWLYTAEH